MFRQLSTAVLELALALVPAGEIARANSIAQEPAPRVDAPPASAPAQPAAAQPVWAHHLAPGTVALIRARSIDALVAALQQVSLAVGEPIEFDPYQELLKAFEVDESLIDRERELVLAFDSFTSSPRVFMPSTLPEMLAASAVRKGAHAELIEGDYVILSSAGGPNDPSAEPHPLSLALLPGQISLHVDLEELLAGHRPMIDMMIADIEEELPALGRDEETDKQRARILGLVHEMLDAASGFGCALRLEDGIAEFESCLTLLEDNPGAGLFGTNAPPLGELRHLIDPDAGISMLSSLDMRPSSELTLDFMDLLVAAARGKSSAESEAGEQLALSRFERALAGWDTFAALCGRAQAMSFDFDPQQGPRMEIHTFGALPEQLATAHAAWLNWAHDKEGGLELGATQGAALLGRNVREWRLRADSPPSTWILGAERAKADEASARVAAKWASWLDSLSLKVKYATRADEWFAALGSDASIARALGRTQPRELRFDAGFERALERCGAGKPAYVMRLDFARIFVWIHCFEEQAARFAGRPPTATPLRFERPAWVHIWNSHGDTRLASGYVVELGRFGEFVRMHDAWEEAQATASSPSETAAERDVAPAVVDEGE